MSATPATAEGTTTEEPLPLPLQGIAVRPSATSPSLTGVLVLAGSSGRIDVERARLLARHGALALALRWFGGPGQAPGICEIPLETFVAAIDWLAQQGATRTGIVGLSKGAEAALLVAVRDARVAAIVAISPSSVVWANLGPGRDGTSYPYRSSWTWNGHPLPFVPYDEAWTPPAGEQPISYRPLYEAGLAASLRADPATVAAATIPIERASGDLLLIAGGDDALWPSVTFAEALAARRRTTGRPIDLIVHPAAGHRPIFPEEPPPAPSTRWAHGGSPTADAALGRAAWPRVLAHLGLP
jgi:dienelactone hydrolase